MDKNKRRRSDNTEGDRRNYPDVDISVQNPRTGSNPSASSSARSQKQQSQSQHSSLSKPSQAPPDHSHGGSSITQQEEARGRQRRRERRRMNRESSRNNGSSSRGSGSRNRNLRDYYRPGEDQWRQRRDYDRHDRDYYEDREFPRDYRGHHGSSFLHMRDLDNNSYSGRSRSSDQASRTGRRRRESSRSRSNDRSIRSRNENSDSRSRRRSLSLSRSRSRSRSFTPERDRSNDSSEGRSDSRRRRERSRERNRDQRRNRGSYKLDHDYRSRRRRSYASSSHSDASASSSSEDEQPESTKEEAVFSKDQRTVFVSQLVMRATEKEIKRYFRRKVGCKVKEVILLRDKRTGSHKGCAYIEMGHLEDVNKAVAVAGQPPDFQRFPILVKASEAERNYIIPASASVVTASMMGASASSTPFLTQDGKVVESQKVYIGGLDPSVSEEHLFALFSQFGTLEKVSMQLDPGTNSRKGYAFLSFKDPKVANLAIKTMANQVLAGRAMKTGWASQPSSIPGVEIVTSDSFPEDAKVRAQKAFVVLAQLSGVSTSGDHSASGSGSSSFSASVSTGPVTSAPERTLTVSVAEAKEVMMDVASGATKIDGESRKAGNAAVVEAISISSGGSSMITGEVSEHILVHNMFDKDTETEKGWEGELKNEFIEECSKFGKILEVKVIWKEHGGRIFATFETCEGASNCANNLAGRWFDKRQLRVEYVQKANLPT